MITDELKQKRKELVATGGGDEDCGEWLHKWYEDHNNFNPEYGKISEVCERAAFAFFGLPWVRKPCNCKGHDEGRDVKVPGLGTVQIKGIDKSWDLLVPSDDTISTNADYYVLVKYLRNHPAILKGWAYRSEVIVKKPSFQQRWNHVVPNGELHPMAELLKIWQAALRPKEEPPKRCKEQLCFFNMVSTPY